MIIYDKLVALLIIYTWTYTKKKSATSTLMLIHYANSSKTYVAVSSWESASK